VAGRATLRRVHAASTERDLGRAVDCAREALDRARSAIVAARGRREDRDRLGLALAEALKELEITTYHRDMAAAERYGGHRPMPPTWLTARRRSSRQEVNA
jgi:hypothetical protein